MDVYYTMGVGFLEPVYQEALAIEFTRRGIPFEREKQLDLYYKGTKLNKTYSPDFVCFGDIVLELKVVVNDFFGALKLEWKQYVI